VGVRHKCLDCDDYDECNDCNLLESHLAQGHAFHRMEDPSDAQVPADVMAAHKCKREVAVRGLQDKYVCVRCCKEIDGFPYPFPNFNGPFDVAPMDEGADNFDELSFSPILIEILRKDPQSPFPAIDLPPFYVAVYLEEESSFLDVKVQIESELGCKTNAAFFCPNAALHSARILEWRAADPLRHRQWGEGLSKRLHIAHGGASSRSWSSRSTRSQAETTMSRVIATARSAETPTAALATMAAATAATAATARAASTAAI
jgi:hypothetical protein